MSTPCLLDTTPRSLKGTFDVKQDLLLTNITTQSGGLEESGKQHMLSVTAPEASASRLARTPKSGEGKETFQVLPWGRWPEAQKLAFHLRDRELSG